MNITESAGGIVLNNSGQVALVQNGKTNPPWWGFPKGHIDAGESVMEAARREIMEETGLTDLILVSELGVYERFKGTASGGDDMSELKKIHMFYFKTDQTELQSQDVDNPEARWIPIDEVLTTLAHPKDREFFTNARTKLEI